jgi:hypothetical protein
MFVSLYSDLCPDCYNQNRRGAQLTRLHAHPLLFTTAGMKGHYCDCCSTTITTGAWHCQPCNFDVCAQCHTRAKQPKPEDIPAKRTSTSSTTASGTVETKTPAGGGSGVVSEVTIKSHAHPLIRVVDNLVGHFCDIVSYSYQFVFLLVRPSQWFSLCFIK